MAGLRGLEVLQDLQVIERAMGGSARYAPSTSASSVHVALTLIVRQRLHDVKKVCADGSRRVVDYWQYLLNRVDPKALLATKCRRFELSVQQSTIKKAYFWMGVLPVRGIVQGKVVGSHDGSLVYSHSGWGVGALDSNRTITGREF